MWDFKFDTFVGLVPNANKCEERASRNADCLYELMDAFLIKFYYERYYVGTYNTFMCELKINY
jgi:hypothetical protein